MNGDDSKQHNKRMFFNREQKQNQDEEQHQNRESKFGLGPGSGQGPGGGLFGRFSPIVFILLIFLLPWIVTLFAGIGQRSQISYDRFKQELETGNVQTVTIQGEKITGTFNQPISTDNMRGETTVFTTFFPSRVSENLVTTMRNQNVEIVTKPSEQGGFFAVLLNFLPLLLMIGIFYFVWRNVRGQGRGGQNLFSIGQSKARRYKETNVKTTFNDVAGIESAKYELQEIVGFLKKPEKYRKIGASTPKGILLVGPPGGGKTLLARAVAGEAGVPFFSISGSDFMEMFVGVGASRVRNMFNEAKKEKPSIIFIDELDSIGRTRGAGLGGGHDEREQTLNQLLSEMDGFEKNESVIVMAATNRPDILDPALLRPGRFDRKVTITLPTMKDREAILKIHSREKPLADDVDLEKVSRNTPGFSGADLENLLNEASLLAAQKDKTQIEQEDLNLARDKILLGLERKSVIFTEREKQVVAWHEMGHALVAALLPNTDPIHKVSIIPREYTMGTTQQLPEQDRYLYDKEYILDRIKVMMGGRAAENFKANTETSGAENDLKQAQQLARKMVLDWGMSEKFKHVALGSQRKQVFLGEEIGHQREYSEETTRIIDEEVQSILSSAYKEAYTLLTEHKDVFDELTQQLLDKEEIQGKEIYELLEHKKKE